MKPTEILRRYQGDISLIEDCVLEMVIGFGEPTTVQAAVNKCVAAKVASQATIHKAIHNLFSFGFLRTVKAKNDFDLRKRWIEPTPVGERRAKEWA